MSIRKVRFSIAYLLLFTGIVSQPIHSTFAGEEIEIATHMLTDETGNEVTLDNYSGYYRLVFFGFTFCPDICPTISSNIARALRSLEKKEEHIKVLFISVDPKRDTPQQLAKYTDKFHPSIIGLTGSLDELRQLAASFGTSFGYQILKNGSERPLSHEEYNALLESNYTVYHGAQIYLLDPEGNLADIIGYGSRSEVIAKKLSEHIE